MAQWVRLLLRKLAPLFGAMGGEAMSDGTTWRLCAVRMAGPDELGRCTTTEVVPLKTSGLGRVAQAVGGVGTIDGAMALVGGLPDTPEVREALGLGPRLVVTREDSEATGVAGVEQ